VPAGPVCLLSALAFHELTTQLPHLVWLALPQAMGAPQLAHPPLRVVRFSGKALKAGVKEHRIENVPVRIYGVAKTVIDCFKFRIQIDTIRKHQEYEGQRVWKTIIWNERCGLVDRCGAPYRQY
jgi:predicted transcriptional regulator of viral defense system